MKIYIMTCHFFKQKAGVNISLSFMRDMIGHFLKLQARVKISLAFMRDVIGHFLAKAIKIKTVHSGVSSMHKCTLPLHIAQ